MKGEAKELAHETVAHKALVQIAAIYKTVHGAEASAIIYSLVETAKANKLKIYEYLILFSD